MTRRIDAHQHFWRLSRCDYGWLTPELGLIHRDFGQEDLAPLLARHGIGATILVQAAPSVEETRFLLELAERAPFVAGVVGWVALDGPEAARQIDTLAAEPLLVGLRPMLHDLPDDDWVLRPGLHGALEAMQRHRLVFDALVRPRHLSRLLALADRYPDLSIVIDHAAKPDIRAGWCPRWAADMEAMAWRPQVSCKLSGLLTEAGEGADTGALRPWVEHLAASFGPHRLMWGSDWPVLLMAGTYDGWFGMSETLLDPAAREAVFGGTADRIYLSHRGRR
ncbi:MAG: amidohydrolase [Roseomonas sp.]|nr:amidohydrolase [Roseomonas sp.]